MTRTTIFSRITLPLAASGAAAMLLAAGAAGAAAALTVGTPIGQDVDTVRAALEAEGYEVLEVELDGDEIEADVLRDGQAFEVEVSVTDGVVTEIELEDDEDDEDDDD